MLRPILSRLLMSDPEAFDAMMWLIWWIEFKQQGCDWREKEIGNLLKKVHEQQATN